MSPDAIHWIASPFGSVDCFLMFSVRILSCFCTLGPLIFLAIYLTWFTQVHFSAVMKTREVHQLFFMKMHQRNCFNSLLLRFVDASRCSMHVLLLVHWYAQRDLNLLICYHQVEYYFLMHFLISFVAHSYVAPFVFIFYFPCLSALS